MQTIAHLDLDCFFVSCERIKNPALIGKPVVVGGNPTTRAVVSSASYEARKFGVRSAMPTREAKRLCPTAIFVSPDFDCYSHFSHEVKHFLERVAPVVEQASIDEFYLDLTGCGRIYPNLFAFGSSVKECLVREFKLPSTVGIASSKLVSKIAVNQIKPDGLIQIEHGREAQFLDPLSVDAMPGIGKVTAREMNRRGLKTLGDVARANEFFLKERFGLWGLEFKRLASGSDDRRVVPWEDPKSISRETTFERDLDKADFLLSVLSSFVEECAAELRHYSFKTRTVTVKFRLPDFKTFERSKKIRATHDEKEIYRTAEQLFLDHWKPAMKLRLLGAGVSNFDTSCPTPNLFPNPEAEKRESLLRQVDVIRAKYGLEAIHIGSSLRRSPDPL